MFSIVLTQSSQEELDRFINSYRSVFFRLYLDTGIQDEGVILDNYRRISKEFKEILLLKIQTQLSADTVLGRRVGEDKNSVILREKSFLIIIDYTEDDSQQIRYIENIIFTKK